MSKYKTTSFQLRNTYSVADAQDETARLLDHSKSLLERVSSKWSIPETKAQQPLEQSLPCLARHTRWAVTGPIVASQLPPEAMIAAAQPNRLLPARTMSAWEITQQHLFGVEPAPPPQPAGAPHTVYAPPPGAPAGRAQEAEAAPRSDPLDPVVGEAWVVNEPARVRTGLEMGSDVIGEVPVGASQGPKAQQTAVLCDPAHPFNEGMRLRGITRLMFSPLG